MDSTIGRLSAASRRSSIKLSLALALGVTATTCVAISADLGPRQHAHGNFNREVSTYVVAEGDDLSHIAKRFELSLEALKAHNGLASDVIQAGDKLRIADADAISTAEQADKQAGLPAPSIADTKAIAEAGFIYGLPIVMNYAVMQEFAVDKDSGQYKAPFNTIFNDARGWNTRPPFFWR